MAADFTKDIKKAKNMCFVLVFVTPVSTVQSHRYRSWTLTNETAPAAKRLPAQKMKNSAPLQHMEHRCLH
jgi:hypothetical protein